MIVQLTRGCYTQTFSISEFISMYGFKKFVKLVFGIETYVSEFKVCYSKKKNTHFYRNYIYKASIR